MIEGALLGSYSYGDQGKKIWVDEKPIPVRAFVCRSCGYIEQFANFDKLRLTMPGRVRSCPKCDAVYSYSLKHETSDGVVKCQNCGVEFHLSVQIECPHCHSLYLYSMEKTTGKTVVPCQNCGESFYLSKDMEVSTD
jgi:predicted Zn finger-like uncharacterized protein